MCGVHLPMHGMQTAVLYVKQHATYMYVPQEGVLETTKVGIKKVKQDMVVDLPPVHKERNF